MPHSRAVSIPLSVLSAPSLLPLKVASQHFPLGGFFWHSSGEGGFLVSSVSTTQLTFSLASGPQRQHPQVSIWALSDSPNVFLPLGALHVH